ncbi:MAG: cobalamin-dependent protein [Candidatus Buchananbacteria bacterium]
MKISLINPPSNCVENDRVEPPLGLLYLASVLREEGHELIQIHDLTGCKNKAEIELKINQLPQADIYGISCFSTNYNYLKKIINHLKAKYPSAYIITGGPHPSALPKETLLDTRADVVVVGEGEEVINSLVSSCENGSPFKGVIFGISRKNIDNYPFPARDLINYGNYSRSLLGKAAVSLISSRGCVHHCIHCNSIVMGGGNKNVRYRSTQNIIAEMKILADQFNYFRFNDDNFCGNPKLKELLNEIKKLNIKFRIFARVDDLDDETCRLLAAAGCIHVCVGLESMNPENLKIIGKGRQIGKEKNVKIAKKYGLIIRASFMVGLPFDDKNNFEKFFSRVMDLGLNEFAVYPLLPYPGTMIWHYPERFGYQITNYDFSRYVQMGKNGRTCYALKHKNFTAQDIKLWHNQAEKILISSGAKHMSESKVAN